MNPKFLGLIYQSLELTKLLNNFKAQLKKAANDIMFLVDYANLSDEHIHLNYTTFNWNEKLQPLIKNRYFDSYSLLVNYFGLLFNFDICFDAYLIYCKYRFMIHRING